MKFELRKLLFTSLFIALGLVIPFFFHLFNLGSKVFAPMHIPVLMCGIILGKKYGLICGFITPLFSSVLTGMPPLFPTGVTMSFELATYGFVCGLLNDKNIYLNLISAQILGRVVGAISNMIVLGILNKPFGVMLYLNSVFIVALPGIIIQLIFIPIIVKLIKKTGLFYE